MKIAGVALLAVINLWLGFLLRVRAGEQERWQQLAVHCVDTAASANDVLQRCMVQLEARRRCICFEEPLQSRVEPTGAQT